MGTAGSVAVLVLDDDAIARATLSHLLSAEGYEVICCINRDALLALCRDTAPACILLDMVLPETSGLNIIKDLRRLQSSAPILMISGHADIESAVRVMKDGAFDFVEKPFQVPDLLSRIKAAVDAFAREKNGESEFAL